LDTIDVAGAAITATSETTMTAASFTAKSNQRLRYGVRTNLHSRNQASPRDTVGPVHNVEPDATREHRDALCRRLDRPPDGDAN
jgi:hypothetical protein